MWDYKALGLPEHHDVWYPLLFQFHTLVQSLVACLMYVRSLLDREKEDTMILCNLALGAIFFLSIMIGCKVLCLYFMSF